MNLNDAAPTAAPPARYYLSYDGKNALGPFSRPQIVAMIRRRNFSTEVMIRGEHERTWSSYRERGWGNDKTLRLLTWLTLPPCVVLAGIWITRALLAFLGS